MLLLSAGCRRGQDGISRPQPDAAVSTGDVTARVSRPQSASSVVSTGDVTARPATSAAFPLAVRGIALCARECSGRHGIRVIGFADGGGGEGGEGEMIIVGVGYGREKAGSAIY